MRIPFLGRLGAFEWPVLLFSLVLVVAEYLLAIITSLLPSFVIHFFDVLTSSLFRLVPTSGINTVLADPELEELVNNIANADGFVEMCRIYGYEAEEHIVKTTDGYLLGIHRIGGPKNSNWRNTSSSLPKPVIYLHHGLLMNSEIWVANVDPRCSLPFVLADMGYDVWLGNNRGNKYSKKHVNHNPNSHAFWNFSMDDFALYDIPDTINYILYIVSQKDLVYIGFSQGSAQAFATLSINPELNKKIRLFIALAPAMAPPGIQNTIVDSLMRASPSLIYLFFGRKAILKSATYWQSIMYPPLFVHTIESSISSLFNWQSNNISYAQKLAAYPHLYSYTSVKSVVHWFQIIRSGRFHMYDDDGESLFFQGNRKFYRVASFPTQNITSPILLLYGKSDSLVDIDIMLSELPQGTASVGFDTYEHLDMIWGDDVRKLIFPYVFSALQSVNHVPMPLNGPDAFDDLATLYGPLPKVQLPAPLTSSINLTLQPSSSSTLYPAPQASGRLLKYMSSVSSFRGGGGYASHDHSVIEEHDEDDQISLSTANFNSGVIGSSTPKDKIRPTHTPRHSQSKIYTKNSSPMSSSASSVADNLAYHKLAHKLSSSFSSAGIDFGSSQPVVEVIRSDNQE